MDGINAFNFNVYAALYLHASIPPKRMPKKSVTQSEWNERAHREPNQMLYRQHHTTREIKSGDYHISKILCAHRTI